MLELIGRESEIKVLSQILKSPNAELAVLYGRRRVGKTHLIRSYFAQNSLYIEFTGIQKGKLSRQLQAFSEKLSSALFNNIPLKVPTSWHEAFTLLDNEINKLPSSKKVVIFFDELPWMVTKRSQLLQEFDHFWNTRWSTRGNVKIILCGSAASWMIDNIVNATGGLHNRLTRKILLNPFDLSTTQKYLRAMGLRYTHQQVTELYMVTGGIPYYLNNLTKEKSLQQNIEALCFNKNGALYDEFPRLFESLYEQAETNLKIIRIIAKHREGISRNALIAAVGIASGGSLNKRIQELEAAGFIRTFIPYGREHRNIFYRVIDEYCLFYLKWIEPTQGHDILKGYWQSKYHSPAWYEWAGYSFENICIKHVEKIRDALELQHVGCTVASWKYIPKPGEKSTGAQIDLLFDRDDNVITLCEIKFSDKAYSITKEYAKSLAQKMDVFQTRVKTDKQLMLALIASNGLKHNLWSEDLVQAVVTLDDLFKAGS
jgi:AAA+ ATPase superfamily predicted ATPase